MIANQLPKRFQIQMDLLDTLYGAFGIVCDLSKHDPLYRLIWATLQECENTLCREDWRVYRNWARRFTEQTGDPDFEPCDAWFESAPLAEPWLDETAEEMAIQAAAILKGRDVS